MSEINRSLALVDPQRVDELSQQLVKYMPGGAKLTVSEAHAMARISLMHGLDPFVGDLYYMKKTDGTPIGIKVGIRAVRKKAMQQASQSGGSYWVTFRQLGADELKALRIPPDSLAFECRLYDTLTITRYVESVASLHTAGLSWLEIQPIVGEKPYTVGIGVFRQGELTKMLPVQCAQKRAEEDALKRRFYLPFDVSEAESPAEEVEPEPGANGSGIVEGTSRTLSPSESTPTAAGSGQTPEEKRAQAEQDKQDLFGQDKKPAATAPAANSVAAPANGKPPAPAPTQTPPPPRKGSTGVTEFTQWCNEHKLGSKVRNQTLIANGGDYHAALVALKAQAHDNTPTPEPERTVDPETGEISGEPIPFDFDDEPSQGG